MAIAVYGRGHAAVVLSMKLKNWSADVSLCTDGPARVSRSDAEALERNAIRRFESRILRLEGSGGMMEKIVFANGETLARDRMFFTLPQRQQSELASTLGCVFTEKGTVRTDRNERTNVRGLFVAGDASRDTQMVVVAAAEGVKAAIAINTELHEEDRS
jgi:thioredoxin reductase